MFPLNFVTENILNIWESGTEIRKKEENMRKTDFSPKDVTLKDISSDKRLIFLLLCLFVLSVWCMVSGVIGLGKDKKPLDDIFTDAVSTGSRYEGRVEAASPCFLQIAHSMNLIPTGNEYYYLIFQGDDYSRAYVVRAGKHWEDLFDGEGFPINDVVISGSIKKMPSGAIKRLDEVISELSENGYPVYVDRIYYLDAQSYGLYGMRVFVGVCILYTLWMLYCTCFKRMFLWETSRGKVVQSISIVAMLCALVCGVYLCTMK